MSAYAVAKHRITNPDGYAEYPPQALQMMVSHGGEFLVADYNSEVLEGSPRDDRVPPSVQRSRQSVV